MCVLRRPACWLARENSPCLCARSSTDPQAAVIAESVEQFITAMDTLKLNMRAVDQICPTLLALITSMDKISSLPPNYTPREKLRVRRSSVAAGAGAGASLLVLAFRRPSRRSRFKSPRC